MAERSRRRARTRSTNRSRRSALGALGCFLVFASAALALPVRAQNSLTATVTPNLELTQGQYVDVAFSGFEPSTPNQTKAVRVRQCPDSATSVNDCASSSPTFRNPGDSRVALIGDDGTGSVPFIIRAQDIPPVSGGDPFFCDKVHACRIMVFQLDSNSVEKSFSDAVSIPLQFAQSTVPCPEGGDKIAGSGGSSARGDLVQWQSEVCQPPSNLNVSYTYTNAIQGTDAFVQGLTDSDFAASAMPMTRPQTSQLHDRGVTPEYVPLSAGSLVLVYNLWFDRNGDGQLDQMTDLQLSPAALAGIYEGRISSWNDPLIAADNPNVKMPVKQVRPVARADNSAATWWLTSWLSSAAPDAYKAGGADFQNGPTTTFPAGRGIILVTGTDAVAQYVRTFPGEQVSDNPDAPFAGFIGYVYYSEALKLGLPVVALKNAAGSYVKPTQDAVTAAFKDGDLASDGTFSPNFNSTDAAAYPVPVASYFIAPSGDSKGVEAKKAETMGKVLMYATGPGQQAAPTRGYVPLTPAMKSAADANTTKIASMPASALEPSPAAAANAGAAPLTNQVLAPAATLGTRSSPQAQAGSGDALSSSAPAGAISRPAAAYANTAKNTASSGPLAPAKAAIAAIRRAIDGVIGFGSVGSVPVGLPFLVFAAVCALLLGRLLLAAARRRSAGSQASDAGDYDLLRATGSDSSFEKVVRLAADLRRLQ